ncbi:hypothetical protein ESCO_006421 [Escovopsis weberi]|uniref:Uncharacterized protein n=1 Tax=Escovopsis weberi TaxID=150374 RepID=A0A0M9VS62_ESCWE|nr:hypothetical protein ESCO_006421 [Escovopsis weberi]
MRLKLHLLELEYKLTTSRIVYASDLRRPGSDLAATVERMVDMWLATNLVDGVYYYKAKDFARRRILSSDYGTPHRERRMRTSHGGGCLQLPADASENRRSEHRRLLTLEGLRRFARRLHREGHSYCLFLGSQDAQWWETYLRQLGGEWWVHVEWHFAVHGRDVAEAGGARRDPEPSGQQRRMAWS